MNFKSLEKNDVVDVVFLGTAGTSEEVKKIANFLQKIDLRANIFWEKETTLKKSVTHEFPSFDPSKRFEQFKIALESDSKIIWCARGGYGSAELLPFLEKLPKPKKSKIFIGFSDISALNKLLIEKWNWQVISAPMLAQIALEKVSQESTKAVVDLLFGKISELRYNLKFITNYDSTIIAKLTGGCISVLVGQFGTKNQIDWNDKILFLEDEGETGERLDRYFHQILQISIEQKKFPKVILLGNFLESNPHGTPKAKNIELAINRLALKITEKKLPIVLLSEKSGCLGHAKNMLPLILGAETKISIDGILSQKL